MKLLLPLLVLATGCLEDPVAKSKTDLPPPDECGASAYQYLLLEHNSELNDLSFTVPFRIIPFLGAVTMDFNPERLNFDLDEIGRITRIHCG